MYGKFTKGLVIGGVLGATIGMMMDPGMMKSRTRKRMMRNGRSVIRKSGDIIGDLVDIFR
jgi:gas vesicle protein